MNAIEIEGLCKKYPGFKLDNINLTLPSGCIMGLIGENGAGKSTMIKLILDIARADGGHITVLGKDNQDNFKLTKEDIGVVLDDVGIPSNLTANHLSTIMKYAFRNWSHSDFFGFLKRLCVPRNKKFKDLSRGTKMKLGVAIALSHKPKLLILDEATAGLDPVARDELMSIFSEFTRDETHSILISSHIVSDLEKICDYIAFLHNGKLMLCEEKDRLQEKYAVLHCTAEELEKLPQGAVIGRKQSPYGVEAIVLRDTIPSDAKISAVDIEQLFVFMAGRRSV